MRDNDFIHQMLPLNYVGNFYVSKTFVSCLQVKSKTKSRNQAWIQDDPDNIVDLADVSSARKITGMLTYRHFMIAVKNYSKQKKCLHINKLTLFLY